ncbi:MAG: hypothetical protein WCP29_19555 [Acidobacteriota bacterium]
MNAVPKWFPPVAIAALLWNLLGCVAQVSDMMVTPQDLAKMSAAQQALYASRPAWAIVATALAVWGGALGSLGLVLRKRWSTPLLLLSLVGVMAQDFGLFVLSGAAAQAGPAVFVVQGLVLLIAVALVWLGRTADAKGWLARA